MSPSGIKDIQTIEPNTNAASANPAALMRLATALFVYIRIMALLLSIKVIKPLTKFCFSYIPPEQKCQNNYAVKKPGHIARALAHIV